MMTTSIDNFLWLLQSSFVGRLQSSAWQTLWTK